MKSPHIRTTALVGAMLFSIAIVGVLVARAQTEDYVTQTAFDAESRALREEVYNLRQQMLEQRVSQTLQTFGIVVDAATQAESADGLTRVCSETKEKLDAYKVLWQKIRDFWPLGNEKLEPLEALVAEHAKRCSAQ